jgi:NAD(P)-dependent dehydrogenase (short-subunit alcohol dehydrogenase family)
VARALIVGCGCRGRELGRALLDDGWQVRGTTRAADRAAAIEATGIETVVADPDRIASLFDHLADVTLIFWLLAGATGDRESVAALHGPRLERMLERIVDTPVRGFVYEASGALDQELLVGAMRTLRDASERWRIPFEVVDGGGGDLRMWLAGMRAAASELGGVPAPREG